jgi:hypothetical protein
MRRFLTALCSVVVLTILLAAPAFAADPHSDGATGQPMQTCLSSTAPNEPGHAANSSGSPFNEVNGTAGSVYAGSGHAATVSGNPNANSNPTAASQYDVACFQVSQP